MKLTKLKHYDHDPARLFDKDDLPLLARAVSLYPDLEFACFATKLAARELKFPISKPQDFAPLVKFEDRRRRALHAYDRIALRRISVQNIVDHFPPSYFPIQDANDMLGKVVGALISGKARHAAENLLQRPTTFKRSPVEMNCVEEDQANA